MEDMEGLLLRSKPCKMLIALRDTSQRWSISKTAKESGATYVYTSAVIKKFENAGLVSSEAHGKLRQLRLTERGAAIASAIDDLVKKLSPQKTQEEQPKQP